MNSTTPSSESELDVIFVGAHPDDVEVACGGTVAKLVQQGYRVGIVDLTDGEPTPLCPDPAVRLAEAEEARKVLGAQKRVILDLPNRRLFDSFEARVALAKEFRRYRPRMVLGIGNRTPTASPDHWQARQITDAAVFYSRLSKWDEHFSGLPVHRIERLMHYHLIFDLSAYPSDRDKLTVDISETLEKKLEAIRCYQTQFPPEKQQVFDKLKGLAFAAGASAGCDAAEILVPTQSVVVRDLMKTVFSD